jgi:hypothetical protein
MNSSDQSWHEKYKICILLSVANYLLSDKVLWHVGQPQIICWNLYFRCQLWPLLIIESRYFWLATDNTFSGILNFIRVKIIKNKNGLDKNCAPSNKKIYFQEFSVLLWHLQSICIYQCLFLIDLLTQFWGWRDFWE